MYEPALWTVGVCRLHQQQLVTSNCSPSAGEMSDAGGGALSMLYIELFHKLGFYDATAQSIKSAVFVTSLAAAAVEALPMYHTLDDNLTVPLTAAAFGYLLLPGM